MSGTQKRPLDRSRRVARDEGRPARSPSLQNHPICGPLNRDRKPGLEKREERFSVVDSHIATKMDASYRPIMDDDLALAVAVELLDHVAQLRIVKHNVPVA